MFSSLLVSRFVCLSGCLFVCLTLSNITGKRMDRFSWNFQDTMGKIQETIWYISWMVCFTPLYTGFLFIFFQGNQCLWASLRKNGWTDFREFFRKGRTWGKEQSRHIRDLVVNLLDPGLIFQFSGSVFVSSIMEKRMKGVSWNFHDMPGTTQQVIL